MRTEIIAKNYQVSEHLKRITEQKFAKLDKYFSGETVVAKVYFKKQAKTLTLEAFLEYAGKIIRATVSSDNFYDNLDLLLPKIEGQIRKHRTKFDKHNKNVAYKEDSLYYAERFETEKPLSVVKNKKFKLTPLTVQEAIEEMELLGHSFFVYKDAKTEEIKILYKRLDGDLGLIEPV